MFVDRDGSVTGTAGRAVVVDNPFLLDQGCESRPAWNAQVCQTDYVTLIVGTTRQDWQALKPATLTRPNGVTQPLMGCCDDTDDAVTSIIPDRSYSMAFNGAAPNSMRFVLWRGRGRWLQLSIVVGGPVKVTRWGRALASAANAGALESKSDSAYFYDAGSGTLHLKIMSPRGDYEEIKVERS